MFYHARPAHTITIRRLSINAVPPREDHDSAHMPYSTAQFRRSLSASGTAWAYTLLAWDQFIGSDNVGRVPIERKLARVPAPRVFPREPKSLLQANITIDHRSQITEERKKKKKRGALRYLWVVKRTGAGTEAGSRSRVHMGVGGRGWKTG